MDVGNKICIIMPTTHENSIITPPLPPPLPPLRPLPHNKYSNNQAADTVQKTVFKKTLHIQTPWDEKCSSRALKMAKTLNDYKNVNNERELICLLKEKSLDLLAKDHPDSPFRIVNFTGKIHYPVFIPHKTKKNRDSDDQFYIFDYHRSSVVNVDDILGALEYGYPRYPSTILCSDISKNEGALFLGGHTSSTNMDFFRTHHITHVVCAARGMHLFPTQRSLRQEMVQEFNAKFLDLDWDDSLLQDIPWKELQACIVFIDEGLTGGNGVLVHCAAGRSRSATVVVAYIVAKLSVSVEEAVIMVQRRRLMAQPNAYFLQKLLMYEKEGMFNSALSPM